MSLRFRAASQPEAPQVRACLLAGFKARDGPDLPPGAPGVEVLRAPSALGGFAQLRVRAGGEPDRARLRLAVLSQNAGGHAGLCHPIDWVASSAVPGGGALLLRSMRALRDLSICVGGTPVARTVIAQTGYKARGEMAFLARPLRPWRQFASHQHRNWKLPVPAGRQRVVDAGPSPRPRPRVVGAPHSARARARRGPARASHRRRGRREISRAVPVLPALSRCPLRALPGEPGHAAGRILPPELRPRAGAHRRCVERRGDAGGLEEPVSARRAGRHRGGSTAEIAAAACLAPAQAALEDSGFRRHDSMPIMLFDPRRQIAEAGAIHLQMIDNDFSFLHAAGRAT